MKSGSNTGIAVFDRKEPTLKGINSNCMYVQQIKKNIYIPITFGTDLVYMWDLRISWWWERSLHFVLIHFCSLLSGSVPWTLYSSKHVNRQRPTHQPPVQHSTIRTL
jgi:hypothetical protein